MTMAEATPSIQQKPYFEEGTEAMIAPEAMVDHADLRNVVWHWHKSVGPKRNTSRLIGRTN